MKTIGNTSFKAPLSGFAEMAFEVMRAAKERGVNIPDEAFVRRSKEELEKRAKMRHDAFIAQDEHERKQREEEARQRKIQGFLKRSFIPSAYVDKFLPSLDTRNDTVRRAVEKAYKYVNNYHEYASKGYGFVFYGDPGLGKTHLSCAILQELQHRYGVEGLYVSTYELIKEQKDAIGKERSPGEPSLLDLCTEADFLVLDEVGVQRGTEYELNLIQTVLMMRFDRLKPTILISNLKVTPNTPNERSMLMFLGVRVIDRIRQYSVQMEFRGPSFRTKVSDLDL